MRKLIVTLIMLTASFGVTFAEPNSSEPFQLRIVPDNMIAGDQAVFSIVPKVPLRKVTIIIANPSINWRPVILSGQKISPILFVAKYKISINFPTGVYRVKVYVETEDNQYWMALKQIQIFQHLTNPTKDITLIQDLQHQVDSLETQLLQAKRELELSKSSEVTPSETPTQFIKELNQSDTTIATINGTQDESNPSKKKTIYKRL